MKAEAGVPVAAPGSHPLASPATGCGFTFPLSAVIFLLFTTTFHAILGPPMSILINFLTVLEVIICLLLILIVLMQRPRQEGLGAAFGSGMTDQMFGAQTTNVLQKATTWLGIGLFVLTFILAALVAHSSPKEKASFVNPTDKAPAPPAASTTTPPVQPVTPGATTTTPPVTVTPAAAPTTTTAPAAGSPAAAVPSVPKTTPAADKPAEPAKPATPPAGNVAPIPSSAPAPPPAPAPSNKPAGGN